MAKSACMFYSIQEMKEYVYLHVSQFSDNTLNIFQV